MERAGAAAFRALVRRWPGARRVTVVCGTGNNGGDGFVAARRAREAGREVRVFVVGDPGRLGRAAAAMLEAMRGAGVGCEPFAPSAALEGVVVDALFGAGLSRPVAGAAADAIDAMNAAGAPVLAVDVPSGLGPDTGSVRGRAVRASLTVTFIAPKRGFSPGPAPTTADTWNATRSAFRLRSGTGFRPAPSGSTTTPCRSTRASGRVRGGRTREITATCSWSEGSGASRAPRGWPPRPPRGSARAW